MAVNQEGGKRYARNVADSGYYTAEDYYAVKPDGDGGYGKNVANERVERNFFTLFPDGFKTVWDGGCEVFTDEG